jgi:GTPase SAR1 family protein
VFLFNREEETVEHRRAIAADLHELETMGVAGKADVWSHHDLLNLAFDAIHKRVIEWIGRWNESFRAEQRAVERLIGGEAVIDVPFDEYELRVDAARLRHRSEVRHSTGDPLDRLLEERGRKIRLLIGEAGAGKTTTISRIASRPERQWLVIPAGRIRGDIANAHALFETALDVDDIIRDASDADRPAWAAVVGPVLKYLTQFSSGIGVIVDALDEAPALATSFGLQRFFNLFRRAVIPIVVTVRTEFWNQRRSDFETELVPSDRESTVQTLEILSLARWDTEQMVRAASRRLDELTSADARERIRRFVNLLSSGDFAVAYGDLPRTPLFLRIILDVLASEEATKLSPAALVRRWARLKIVRDVEQPARTGGERLSIGTGVADAEETVRRSFSAMRTAARLMSTTVDGEVRLKPDCTFDEIEARMGVRAPQSALALVLNSLLVPSGPPRDDGLVSLRFAHRLFQEFFLATEISADPSSFHDIRLPEGIAEWIKLIETDARQATQVSKEA